MERGLLSSNASSSITKLVSFVSQAALGVIGCGDRSGCLQFLSDC
jgi:hypothetical protein